MILVTPLLSESSKTTSATPDMLDNGGPSKTELIVISDADIYGEGFDEADSNAVGETVMFLNKQSREKDDSDPEEPVHNPDVEEGKGTNPQERNGCEAKNGEVDGLVASKVKEG